MKKIAFVFLAVSALVGAVIACGDAPKPAVNAGDVTNSASSAANGASSAAGGAASAANSAGNTATSTASSAMPKK
jgi:hypothetical protein